MLRNFVLSLSCRVCGLLILSLNWYLVLVIVRIFLNWKFILMVVVIIIKVGFLLMLSIFYLIGLFLMLVVIGRKLWLWMRIIFCFGWLLILLLMIIMWFGLCFFGWFEYWMFLNRIWIGFIGYGMFRCCLRCWKVFVLRWRIWWIRVFLCLVRNWKKKLLFYGRLVILVSIILIVF